MANLCERRAEVVFSGEAGEHRKAVLAHQQYAAHALGLMPAKPDSQKSEVAE
jgi:hypothetical protein